MRPATIILLASVSSGAAGYVTTAIAAAQLGPTGYAAFAVFWATLYLIVGAFGGIQQEVTRATTSTQRVERGARLGRFAAVASFLMLAAVILTGFGWAALVFPSDLALPLLLPLAIGSASYVVVAVLAGGLYGIRAWGALATLIAVDGALRLVLVTVALQVDPELLFTAWAVVLPFPLAVVIVLPIVAGRLRRLVGVDVGYRRLSWNVSRTLLAAGATALLISALPLLLTVSSPALDAATVGSIILVLTLARAPIIIPLLSLQSYLIVRFTDPTTSVTRAVVRLCAAIVAASGLLAGIGAVAGPWMLAVIVGSDFVVSPTLIAIVVGTAGLVAALCVTGPAVLAAGEHSAYVVGWVASAVLTAALFFLPLAVEPKLLVALSLGPIAGLVVHSLAIRRGRV